MNKLIEYLLLMAVLLQYGCSHPYSEDRLPHVEEYRNELHCFQNDQPTTYHQLAQDGSFQFFQSVKGVIYKIEKDGDYEEYFDPLLHLDYDTLAKWVLSEVEGDSLRKTEKHLRNIRIENFYHADSIFWVVPVFILEKPELYDGQVATRMLSYKLLLGLDPISFRVLAYKNFFDVVHNRSSDTIGERFTSRLGFALDDSLIYIRNLIYTENAKNAPEIMKCNWVNSDFNMDCFSSRIRYSQSKLNYPITIDRGFFYGEGRSFYSGTSGIFQLSDTNFVLVSNDDASTPIIARSASLKTGVVSASISASSKKRPILEYRLRDSLIFRKPLPPLKNFYSLDISSNLNIWLVYRDTIDSNLWLEIFELSPHI